MCSLRYLNGRTLSPFPAEAGQNCVASPASLFLCASTSLRQRVLRPQLKRDPLGGREVEFRLYRQRGGAGSQPKLPNGDPCVSRQPPLGAGKRPSNRRLKLAGLSRFKESACL